MLGRAPITTATDTPPARTGSSQRQSVAPDGTQHPRNTAAHTAALFALAALPDLRRRLHGRHVFIRGRQTIPALVALFCCFGTGTTDVGFECVRR